MKSNGNWISGLVILAGFAGILVAGATCSPGPDKATAALRAHGFRDVAITGTHRVTAEWYGCSEQDAVAHEATATNPAGERVALVVCCGWPLKGCTVRTP